MRSDSALIAQRIGNELPQIRVLFNLWDKVERRVLPPVDLAYCQSNRCIPRVGGIAPNHLIDVQVLAAGRSARGFSAGHIVRVPEVHDLLPCLPLVASELERA